EAMRRTIGFLGPGGRDDDECGAAAREVGGERRELEVITDLEPDPMALELDDRGLGPRFENQRLSIPQMDFPIDRRAVGTARERGIVEGTRGALGEAASAQPSPPSRYRPDRRAAGPRLT